MKKIYYDFHLHSCLSPCGDDDMTPGNIAGMAFVKGLGAAALTDHNTCDNCEAFLYQTEKLGIVGIAGMELTTAEEIHVTALFEELRHASAFSKEVGERRMKIKNNEKIFGSQLIIGKNDEVCGNDEYFLPAATSIPLEEAYSLILKHNGTPFPAHIDKSSNGIIGILGTMPEVPDFRCAEYSDREKTASLQGQFPVLKKKRALVNSDAHYLWDISDAENFLEIPSCGSLDATRREIFELLNSLVT